MVELTPGLKEELGIDKKVAGVVVKEVEPDSRFSGSLTEGDCILGINNEEVSSVGDFEKVTKKLKEKESLLLDIIRGGKSVYVSISESE